VREQYCWLKWNISSDKYWDKCLFCTQKLESSTQEKTNSVRVCWRVSEKEERYTIETEFIAYRFNIITFVVRHHLMEKCLPLCCRDAVKWTLDSILHPLLQFFSLSLSLIHFLIPVYTWQTCDIALLHFLLQDGWIKWVREWGVRIMQIYVKRYSSTSLQTLSSYLYEDWLCLGLSHLLQTARGICVLIQLCTDCDIIIILHMRIYA
jgi:hypothetical protein